MHAKYQRRASHAERALFQERQLADVSGGLVIGGITITGPFTFTVVNTVSSPSSTTSSIPTTSSSSSSSSSSIPSTTLLPTPTRSSLSSTRSSIITPTPSILQPPVSPVTPQGSLSLSSQISPGAIAGIVIGVIFFLGIILFFILRTTFKRNRIRLRKLWTRSSGLKMPPPIESTSYEPKSYGSPGFQGAGERSPPPLGQYSQTQQAQATPASLAVQIPAAPPSTYNNEFNSSTASPAGIYSAGTTNSMPLSPFSATVVSTFITTLPDELAIKVGETVRVLAEYDDGWSLCMNTNGEQGMIPLACLNQRGGPGTANSYSGLAPPSAMGELKAMRRTSSLDASGMVQLGSKA